MIWYYVKDGAASGPISDAEFMSKWRAGSLLPTTLVWRSGMAEWKTAASVADEAGQRSGLPAIGPVATPAADYSSLSAPPELSPGTPPVQPNYFCTSCGNIIPADQLVRISGRNVCATCKPAYVQQVREGLDAPVRVPMLQTPAPFPRQTGSDLADPALRLVGYILDLMFIGIPLIAGYALVAVISFGTLTINHSGPIDPARSAGVLVAIMSFVVLAFVWVFFYWTFFIGKRGSTPGMKIMKLKMVRADRSSVTYSLALGRAVLLYVINGCTMGLTNLTAFFDHEKRTVVDMICNTRVVRNDN